MVGQSIECVYCGAANPTTMDHIPPKGIFPPPRSANLTTVPCCEECNRSFDKDESIFERSSLPAMMWETTQQH